MTGWLLKDINIVSDLTNGDAQMIKKGGAQTQPPELHVEASGPAVRHKWGPVCRVVAS
jgi:hypothetical protein